MLSHFNLEDEIDCRNYIAITLMIDSGLRLSELIRLEVSDCYIEQSYIKVKGKGDKERIVPIGTFSQKAILKYLNFLRPQPALDSIKNLLLCSDGKPITKETIKSMVVRLSKMVDIHRLHPHLCRHTFSTRYLMVGGNLFTLQSILGHTSLEMVRNYSHLAASHATLKHKQLSPIDNLMLGK
ncbi:MAG: tyrosine-type recombinase/integrase [Clostridia bacterium]|nr:tyrosine-type recombinase/integrase [Clostridia bacterium]